MTWNGVMIADARYLCSSWACCIVIIQKVTMHRHCGTFRCRWTKTHQNKYR